MLYVIAYDIANLRRLRRIARRMEKHAVRCQNSVFLFNGTANTVQALLDEMTPLIKVEEDLLQAWPVSPTPTTYKPSIYEQQLKRGRHASLFPRAVILATNTRILISEKIE